MASVIVGSPSLTGKILRRQNYNKELSGLETISETYLIRSESLLSLIPSKNTSHASFSTASTKFSRMVVETVSSNEQDGGITELSVQYAGLTSSSGLPPAVVRIIPATGAGIFGPPINIEAEFVSDLDTVAITRGQLSSFSQVNPSVINGEGLVSVYRMPFFINGTKMPDPPKQPYKQEGYGATSSFSYRYEGYVMNSFQVTQRGIFTVANVTFKEYASSMVAA